MYPQDYQSVRRLHDAIKPVRGTNVRPLTTRRSRYAHKTVRMDPDESIVFQLYRTDVVRWHPDGCLTVEGYPSVTTVSFANRFLPDRMWLAGGEHVAWRGSGDSWKETVVAPCHAPIKLRPEGETWVIADYGKNDKLRKLHTDRKISRQVRERWDIAGFEMWWRMGRPHWDGEHERGHSDKVIEALEARDWPTAARFLPIISGVGGAFGRSWGDVPPDVVEVGNGYIGLGSLRTVYQAVLEDAGAYYLTEHETLPRGVFETHKRRLRDVYEHRLEVRRGEKGEKQC